jgi:hypothetical protein
MKLFLNIQIKFNIAIVHLSKRTNEKMKKFCVEALYDVSTVEGSIRAGSKQELMSPCFQLI